MHFWTHWPTAKGENLIGHATELGAPEPLLVRAACASARAALPLTYPGTRASCDRAIAAAERWTRGEATKDECRQAYRAVRVPLFELIPAFALDAACFCAMAAASVDGSTCHLSAQAVRSAHVAFEAAWGFGKGTAHVRAIVHGVLPAEVMGSLALRYKVLGTRPSKRDARLFNDALPELRALALAWTEVAGSGHPDEHELLAGLAERAREVLR